MLIFKKILNFQKDDVYADEKRQALRYAVGHPFPFKVVLTLRGHDGEGHVLADESKSQDWVGRLVNISATGASMQAHTSALASRTEPCRVNFTLGDYHLDMPSTVAHFRVYRDYALCGVSFIFSDFQIQKAYLQLLEPVIIGASLSAANPKTVKQDAPGLLKEQYTGESSSLLTVWRSDPGGLLHSFDFRMNNYGVRWGTGMAEMDTYGVQPPAGGKKGPGTLVRLTETQQDEVRWLFCLAVPNLSKSVPADVRKFLGGLVAT